MHKIQVHAFSDSVGLLIFNWYYAFQQSKNRNNRYISKIDIQFGPPTDDAVNIAFASMPEHEFCNFDDYDLVLLDNAGEPLETSTVYIANCLKKYSNAYYVTGAFVDQSHPLCEKIISFNHNIGLVLDCMTRGFYPQYFDRTIDYPSAASDLCYINGGNRSNRQYFMDLLNNHNVDIKIKSSASAGITEVPECQFEDSYDEQFRRYVNSLYNISLHESRYLMNNIPVGIKQSHGTIPAGYFLIDEYYQHGCVVFPETQWINNQHFMTEKIFKCFISGTIPWPVAGANLHQMYNQQGYQTAWNLLPSEHQQFDNELDHIKRYHMIIDALKWLTDNKQVLSSDMAKQIIHNNRYKFFTNTLNMVTVKRLDQLLQTVSKFNV